MRDSEDGAAADEAGGDSTIWVHQTHVLLQVRPSNAALGSRATARCVRTRSMSWSWAWRSVALGTRPASVGLDHALCFHCRAEGAMGQCRPCAAHDRGTASVASQVSSAPSMSWSRVGPDPYAAVCTPCPNTAWPSTRSSGPTR